MPKLHRHETSLVFEVIAIELGAEQERVRLGPAVLGLDIAQ
jgi:hypothetical protein